MIGINGLDLNPMFHFYTNLDSWKCLGKTLPFDSRNKRETLVDIVLSVLNE